MKKPVKIIFIILAVIVVLFLTRNIIVKGIVETGARAVVGLKLDIKKFNIDVFGSLINISGMKLYNPKGFPDPVMVDIPEIHVDYKMGSFLTGKPHLEEVRLHLKEFVVVKNKEGEINLDKLKALAEGKKKDKDKKEKKEEKKAPPEFTLDKLHFRVDRVVSKDYSGGGEPSVKEFNINLDERHENISNANVVVMLIVSKALAKTTIASLMNFDLGGLQNAVAGSLGIATEKAGAIVGKTTETLKGTTEGLKNIIKSPFGKSE